MRRISPFAICGMAAVFFAAIFAGRMLWEETLLTWRQGPQMLGFSLAHGPWVVLFLAPIALSLWLAIALVALVVYLVKRRRPSFATLATAAAGVLIIGLLSIPPQFWIWLFAGSFAHSPHAADLTAFAAVQSQTHTAIALIEHGVPVNAANHEGNTPLHSAAIAGDVPLLKFLLSRQAALNAPNGDGDSPLQLALDRHQTAAASYLQSRGAQRIEGTQEQRNNNADRVVREDMEEFHRR
jgi:hypothetical protein